MFAKVEIVPRWIIFTIDICLSVFALVLAKVLKNNFIIENINSIALYKSILLVI